MWLAKMFCKTAQIQTYTFLINDENEITKLQSLQHCFDELWKYFLTRQHFHDVSMVCNRLRTSTRRSVRAHTLFMLKQCLENELQSDWFRTKRRKKAKSVDYWTGRPFDCQDCAHFILYHSLSLELQTVIKSTLFYFLPKDKSNSNYGV